MSIIKSKIFKPNKPLNEDIENFILSGLLDVVAEVEDRHSGQKIVQLTRAVKITVEILK